jgi:hypothetical protein
VVVATTKKMQQVAARVFRIFDMTCSSRVEGFLEGITTESVGFGKSLR